MAATSLNHLWAEYIVDELVRCGCTRFYLSPGSRNTPLLLAAFHNLHTLCKNVIDERAAAYEAVGYARATGRPAVLVCTSGTAVANYLPAVTEASHSALPLIVLSADRPVELLETGANQTTIQPGIFGPHLRWNFDLSAPQPKTPITSVLTAVDQLVYRARRMPAGPVHLNCHFAEPLTPDVDDPPIDDNERRRLELRRASETPLTHYAETTVQPLPTQVSDAAARLARSKRGLIVAGRLDGLSDPAPVLDLAEKLRMPILADPTSGLRSTDDDLVITHYDHLLRNEAFAASLEPDCILHLGGAVVSGPLLRWLAQVDCEYVAVDRTPWRQDPAHRVTLRLEADPVALCPKINANGRSALLPLLHRADAICEKVVTAADDPANEEIIVRRAIAALPEGAGLFLGNSMPVRDADACGLRLAQGVRVGCNRGLSGIDGTVASAVGFAEGIGRRTMLVIGDLALLHDLGSLARVARSEQPLTIVVVNNDGGGIFSFLPIATKTDRFEEAFGNAHGFGFEDAAKNFGLDHVRPESMSDYESALRDGLASPRSGVVEVRTDRAKNLEAHRALQAAIDRALVE